MAATASNIAEQDTTADGEVSAAADSISGQVLAADAANAAFKLGTPVPDGSSTPEPSESTTPSV
ncbi:hypothetical protein IPG36_07840 [bacterium]|nr:MAG: hypothetical protein IPG36_07840 [bacterium]